MNIIRPSFQILEQGPGIDGMYKHIEIAGRTCYKSEDKITEGSAKKFVERMINSGHGAMLEHGTVYLKNVIGAYRNSHSMALNHYSFAPYSKYTIINEIEYVTTNLRVLVENGWLDDLKLLCEPTEFHEKRISVLFHTQIAISREYNRHRVNSIAESSTRYCNYSKDKFGSEITINLPTWIDQNELERKDMSFYGLLVKYQELADHWNCRKTIFPKHFEALDYWLMANLTAEYCYMGLIECGWQAQQARTILPLDTNTDLVHTAFISDWKHFFDLRATGTTGKPHPDASCLAIPLYEEFKKRNLIE